MDNQHKKITNIQLNISENCSEENKKIIQLYWELKDTKFLNSPTFITNRFDISQSELNNLNKKFVEVSLHILCKNCTSYEKHKTTSQSSFAHVLNLQKGRYTDGFTCNHCKEEERIQANLVYQKKKNELNEKLNNAIENKNWENLSNFDKAVLKHALEINFNDLKNYYGSKLGPENFKQLIKALYNIENQNLLILHKDSWNNYITNYEYVAKLVACKDEIIISKSKENQPENSVTINTETNGLKFKLTINEFQNHPDSPKFAGLVTFKQKIVIEPDVEYVFGQWQRANDQLYLTLIPKENMDKLPTQKRISNTPISLQKGITDFLNNMGKNNNFK
ncbi:hypothetical protein CW731_06255 [Polaribacter sp. ALD11]|uniref:hypothetical protein n=1 Tax=Polaribacter sp. ALD11 TaxID=2058137 RepID=UPI000C314553|nr:hypothetical protein [Polaribacter sp. ALD11]AUC84918.1 hypothetical protein CW731_06255 [Polaribacter sp. ALD11]